MSYYPSTPQYRAPRHTGRIVGLAVLIVVLLGTLGVILFIGLDLGRPKPAGAFVQPVLTTESAQRECRTAVEREIRQRAENVNDDVEVDSVLATVGQITTEPPYPTNGGMIVHGAGQITLTTPLLDPLEQSISLTCMASELNGVVVTSVKNRT